jgi:hypothetical protein
MEPIPPAGLWKAILKASPLPSPGDDLGFRVFGIEKMQKSECRMQNEDAEFFSFCVPSSDFRVYL